jgi:vesicle coat complex subunit
MVKTDNKLVIEYHPSAKYVLRIYHKTYYQILNKTLCDTYEVLTQSKTKKDTWKILIQKYLYPPIL